MRVMRPKARGFRRQRAMSDPTPALPLPVRLRRAGRPLALALCAALTAGCTIAPPKPWEKGVLARPEMSMDGDALEARYTEHIYTSKETATGGGGVGGAGCGCN